MPGGQENKQAKMKRCRKIESVTSESGPQLDKPRESKDLRATNTETCTVGLNEMQIIWPRIHAIFALQSGVPLPRKLHKICIRDLLPAQASTAECCSLGARRKRETLECLPRGMPGKKVLRSMRNGAITDTETRARQTDLSVVGVRYVLKPHRKLCIRE